MVSTSLIILIRRHRRHLHCQLSIVNLKFFTDDLAANGLRQAFLKLHDTGVLVGRGTGFDVLLNGFTQLVSAHKILDQHDACLDHLSTQLVGCCGNASFQNVGQLHNNVFDLEGTDAVAGRLDNVVDSANVPEESVCITP